MWIVYFCYENNWGYKILSTAIDSQVLLMNKLNNKSKRSEKLEKIGISVLDRYGNESEIKIIEIH